MIFKICFFFLSLVLCINNHITDAAYCKGSPDPKAKPNLQPIIDGKLKFVREVKNARLYHAGEGDDQIDVVHLWGSPFEMGVAHGTIQRDRIIKLVNTVWTYLENEIIDAINGTSKGIIREDFLKVVADIGLDAALDLENLVTDPYTGSYFMEQIEGMAKVTGLDAKKIRRIHLLGELTKGSCSMLGAWDTALPRPNGLLQLRALDWITDGGLQNWPEITVYHPSGPEYGSDFANIGWSGWVGSIQGFNSRQLATSEIGVSYPDHSYGKESRVGIPFTYLLRDILQFDNSLEDAQKRLKNAHRTCYLILGVGDGKSNKFNSVQYSHSVANFMNDTTLKPEADWHPKIKNVVYHGMDWLCPGFNKVMAQQINSLYGNLTAENAIRYVTPIVQSGSLLTIYYDFPNDLVYIANARSENEKGPSNAFDRSFVKIQMSQFFKETPPKV